MVGQRARGGAAHRRRGAVQPQQGAGADRRAQRQHFVRDVRPEGGTAGQRSQPGAVPDRGWARADRRGRSGVPLKETSADVSIAGVIARVQVHQLFENTGRRPDRGGVRVPGVDARGGARRAHEDRRSAPSRRRSIKKAAARESYETARARGQARVAARARAPERVHDERRQHHAGRSHRGRDGLLGDADPRRGDLRVRLPDGRRAALRGRRRPGKDKWMANPHLPAGTPEPYKFDIKVHLETGIAIKELSSPSHQVAVNYAGPSARRRDASAAGRRQPRLRAALPAGGRQDRERPAAVGGRGRWRTARELLRADDGAAAPADGGADPAARVHLPARRVGVDARLPARHGEGADAQPAGPAAADRHLQHRAVLGRGARAQPAGIHPRQQGRHRRRDRRHRKARTAAAAPS